MGRRRGGRRRGGRRRIGRHRHHFGRHRFHHSRHRSGGGGYVAKYIPVPANDAWNFFFTKIG